MLQIIWAICDVQKAPVLRSQQCETNKLFFFRAVHEIYNLCLEKEADIHVKKCYSNKVYYSALSNCYFFK